MKFTFGTIQRALDWIMVSNHNYSLQLEGISTVWPMLDHNVLRSRNKKKRSHSQRHLHWLSSWKNWNNLEQSSCWWYYVQCSKHVLHYGDRFNSNQINLIFPHFFFLLLANAYINWNSQTATTNSSSTNKKSKQNNMYT